MDYIRIYARLVRRAIGRNLVEYAERHHVLPRCLGGSDAPENIVKLTPEEHYVAHQLLVKMHPDHHGLAFALLAMTMKVRGHRTGNKQFGWVRRRVARALKVQRTGVARPREMMEKIWAGNRGRVPSDEERAKNSAAHKGKSKSAEHNAKISASLKGRPSPMLGRQHSEETKQKQRDAALKRRHSAETIAKLTAGAAAQTQEQRSARAFKAWETRRARRQS